MIYKQPIDFNAEGLELVKGGLFDEGSLNELVKDCDCVIHCAGKISINSNKDPSVYITNVIGTKNIFNAAKRANVRRFIYISSIHAFCQIPTTSKLDETRAYCTDKACAYDRSKNIAQQYVLQPAIAQMETIALNPTAIVGPFDLKPSLMGKAIMDIYNRKVPSLIEGGIDFCDVRDVAAATVQAIQKGRTEQAYLLSGKWHSLAELQEVIIHIRGDKKRIPILPAWTAYLGLPAIQLLASFKKQTPLYTRESIDALVYSNKKISNEKAAEELGYTCRPMKESVADAIACYKEQGWLK